MVSYPIKTLPEKPSVLVEPDEITRKAIQELDPVRLREKVNQTFRVLQKVGFLR